MTDDAVVTLPIVQAGQVRRDDDPEQARGAPRIVQYINAETADRLMVRCGATSTEPVLALDDQGRTWSLEPLSEDSRANALRGRLIWRRLTLPPLPGGHLHD